ncbi:MAG: MoaD/ThiS family protein [Bdellovibrio sp.]
MKSITIQYFAQLRDWSGKDSEIISFAGKTYRELYQELASRYSFKLPIEVVQIAINDEFGVLDQHVQDHDRIVFIPPVAGG